MINLLYYQYPVQYYSVKYALSYLIRHHRIDEANSIFTALYDNKHFNSYSGLWKGLIELFKWDDIEDYHPCMGLTSVENLKQGKEIYEFCKSWAEKIPDLEERTTVLTYVNMMKDERINVHKTSNNNSIENNIINSLLKNHKTDNQSYSSISNPRRSFSKHSLDELMTKLNSLVGLENVKKEVNSLIHLQEISRIRKERGLKEIPISNHLVFSGNPGTGKTTVARLLAEIYHVMGILSKGHLVEVDRSGLVAGYVGQTALKVQEVVNKSLGGVLFIDEAYTLSYSTSDNDYGQEAIDTLIKSMEDHREDFIVIVAGYPELMSKFIKSNPGLQSRFNKYINFEDYTVRELVEIYKIMCKEAGYIPTEEVMAYTYEVFSEKYHNRTENFGNAREVRNYFEKAITNQANRLITEGDLSNEQLCTFILSDVKE